MSIFNRLRSICRSCFTKPTAASPIFDAIRDHHVRKIVELGIGDGQRALQMIAIARKASPESEIRYVGLDLFEGRTEKSEPALSLKAAHQLLHGSGAKTQLVPGDPAAGLTRIANATGQIDLLLVPSALDSPEFARMWFFVPRMLHDGSLVFVEGVSPEGEPVIRLKSHEEITALAADANHRRAA